jgi:hypothetical protein
VKQCFAYGALHLGEALEQAIAIAALGMRADGAIANPLNCIKVGYTEGFIKNPGNKQ